MKKSSLFILALVIAPHCMGYPSFGDQVARVGFDIPKSNRLCPLHNIVTVATVALLGAALISAIKLAYDSAKKASEEVGEVVTLKKRSLGARFESLKKLLPKTALCTAGLVGTYITASLMSAISAGTISRSDIVQTSIGTLAALGLIFYVLREAGQIVD